MDEKTPSDLLAANAQWSRERTAADPGYFRRLSGLQAPKYLWIGCSDSRVPANVITGLEPGEVFVHRNVANLVYPTDLNCMSVLEFAVETLHVQHIIVCGHYGCGGIRAVLEDGATGGVQYWLASVRRLHQQHRAELLDLDDEAARADRLCELNVVAQALSVRELPVVKAARSRGQPLTIHGWIYGLTDGRLRDLSALVQAADAEAS
jgi:carbonic anhydrase